MSVRTGNNCFRTGNVRHFSDNVGYLSVQVGYLSVQVSYLSVQVGYLSVQVGYLSAQVGYLSVQVGYLSVQVSYLSAHDGYLSVQVSYLSVHVSYLIANVGCPAVPASSPEESQSSLLKEAAGNMISRQPLMFLLTKFTLWLLRHLDRRRLGRRLRLRGCLLDNCRQRLRDLVDEDITLIFNDLIDHLKLFLVKITRHQHAILVDGHRIDTKQLVLKVLKE